MPLARMGEGLGLRPPAGEGLTIAVGLPRPDPLRYDMADYDFYAGPVDFSIARAHGLRRPIIRVGQGYYGEDPQFRDSAANSKGLFDIRDFYWMLDSHQSANGQANEVAGLISDYGQPDPASILYADFELAPVDAAFLYGFMVTFHSALATLLRGIYTGYSYWQQYGSINPIWAAFPLWIAWPVDPYREPPPLRPWATYLVHQWTFNGDGPYYGTGSGGLDLDYMNPAFIPAPTDPDAYVVRRPKATYDLRVTPGAGALPLLSAVEAAQQYSWECAMNGGIGFDYVPEPDGSPSKYAIPRTGGPSIAASDGAPIYYVRPAVASGVVPAANRNPDFEPWCVLAEDATDWIFIVTRGSGMNELQAAQYALAQGAVNAWILDSDRSAQIEENGVMLYWPYGIGNLPAPERVPVHIGLKPKGVTGMASKVTVKANCYANLKDCAGSGSTLHVAQPGEYVYGTLNAAGDTVSGFLHYYDAQGVQHPLTVTDPTKGAKVSIGTNVTKVDNVVEPGTPPPPPPAGVPHMHQVLSNVPLPDGTTATYTFDADGVKQ